MKIILDECLPKKLKYELSGHKVKTVPEMGWAGYTNGKLLSHIEKEFEVFITADNNLAFQQNLKEIKITILILAGASNRFEDLKPLMPKVLDTLTRKIKSKVIKIS